MNEAVHPVPQPRPLLILAGACACMLVGLLALEYHSAVSREGRQLLPSPPVSVQAVSPGRAAAATPDPAHVQEWTRIVLARPLFSPSRRPAATTMSGPQRPRLAGIVVGPAGRLAIFAGAGGERGAVAAAGQQAGAWRVVSIDTDSVRVLGPEGPRTLHPTRDDSARGETAGSAATPLPEHPSILDLLRSRPMPMGGPGANMLPPSLRPPAPTQ